MAGASGPLPFQFTLLPPAMQQLRTLATLARQRGLSADFARDLDDILIRLQTDPGAWGDPLFNYHALQLIHFRGMSGYLITHYSVHFSAQQVFVQSFAVHPYSRLA